jgi:carboxyl-terminal processing protease
MLKPLMRRALLLLALGGLLGGAFALGFFLPERAATPAPRVPSVVDAVRNELAARYYRPIPEDVLRLNSVQSMLAALGDPYTEYLDRPAYLLLQRQTAGAYTGIGVTLLPAPAGLLVVATQPGPGRRAGIRVGDTIVRIGSVPAAHLGLAGALTRIAGPRGSSIALRVRRAGRRLEFTVRRAAVIAPAVSARLLSFGGQSYGYVRVALFRDGTARRVRGDVEALLRRGAGGVVLDLREDPGGFVDEAVGVASVFLRRGIVVALEGVHHPREEYEVRGPVTAPRIPLTVLVDRFTASSAEIVAAALQDNRRATLIGEHTFGKAVVQSIDPLSDGGALALTTARYITPGGADISRRGVRPDVKVIDDPRTPMDDVLTTALATLASARS